MFERFDCKDCSLWKTCDRYIVPVEPREHSLLVVFGYPTKDQAAKGSVTGTPTWQRVKAWLANASIDAEDVHVTTLVKCSVDKASVSQEDLNTAIESCSKYLEQEIEQVQPRAILALGKDALEYFGAESFSKQVGKVIGSMYGPVIGSYLPAFLDAKTEGNFAVQQESHFRRLKALLDNEDEEVIHKSYGYTKTVEEVEALVKKLDEEPYWTFDTEGTGLNFQKNKLIGIGFSWSTYQAVYVPIRLNQPIIGLVNFWGKDQARVVELLKSALMNDSSKGAQNGKYDIKCIQYEWGVWVKNYSVDSILIRSIVNPSQKRYSLAAASEEYADLDGYKEEVKDKELSRYPVETIAQYNNSDTDLTLRIIEDCSKKLEQDEKLAFVFTEILMPLNDMIARMEYSGVRIDTAYAKILHKELFSELEALENAIYNSVGRKFNIRSHTQLSDVLFNVLKLKSTVETKKGSGNLSTGKAVLTKLLEETGNDTLRKMMVYKSMAANKTAFVDAFVRPVDRVDNKDKDYVLDVDGRYHGNYKLVSSTGRLRSGKEDESTDSEKSLNMQNMSRDKRFRNLFIPDEGQLWASADNAQMELRILAEVSQDPELLGAFEKDYDPHSFVGGLMAGLEYEEVLAGYKRGDAKYTNIRNLSKNIGFGWVYMASDGRFSDLFPGKTKPERDRAEKEAKDRYFQRFSRIVPYRSSVIRFAKENGFVRTLIGRKISIEYIDSNEMKLRIHAEKQAVNAVIQSPASDLNCLAAIILDRFIAYKGWNCRVVNLIHDAIDCSIDPAVADDFYWAKKIIMEKIAPKFAGIKVKMKADMDLTDKWKGKNLTSTYVVSNGEEIKAEVEEWSAYSM